MGLKKINHLACTRQNTENSRHMKKPGFCAMVYAPRRNKALGSVPPGHRVGPEAWSLEKQNP